MLLKWLKQLFVLPFLVLLLLRPSATFAQETRYSVKFEQGSLEQALGVLRKVTGQSIAFSKEEVKGVEVRSAEYSNSTVEQILNGLLANTPLTVEKKGSAWLIKKGAAKTTAAPKPGEQTGKVTGRIIDYENGQPVPGATIRFGSNGVATGVDGSFIIVLPPGSYTAAISNIGYGAKEVSGIEVAGSKVFELNVTLKREKGQLSTVVVKASAKKESIYSLFVRQKNAAGLSDGISAEQISATPDKHIGETLKRITGVSTVDNRKVVVRGIAERYNVALLNGSTLPSTDIQERDFEFNLIPTNLVENIVVAKSITPDMPYSFAGGLVQITTKSVPTSNFTSVSAGISINTRTTGKDFLGYQRGRYDYLGFDDGNRDHFPDQLLNLSGKYNPRRPDDQNEVTAAQIGEQNKRIGGLERLGTRTYNAMPSQNYQVSLGRVYSLSKTKDRTLGFVGSLTYRNTQSNDYIASMRRGGWSRQPSLAWDTEDVNTGNLYGFNTTWGALLNGGFKTAKHEINTYNLYTRIFDDRFSRITGWTHENPKYEGVAPIAEEDDRPKFSSLLQNKLMGAHRLGRFKVEWGFSRTRLETLEQDAVAALLVNRTYANTLPLFQYVPQQVSDPGIGNIHRDEYIYKENNLSADLSVAYDLKWGKTSHTFKTGFNVLGKHAWYDWNILPIVTVDVSRDVFNTVPIRGWGDYMSMEDPLKDLFYYPGSFSLNAFEAKSISKSGFLMFDSKLLPNLRVVGGVRAEYFRTDTLKNAASTQEDLNIKLYMDDSVRTYWLPSLNITYTPVTNFNVRVSYAESVIRPGLMENARFARYNPGFGTILRSRGVVSTHIKNYDAKLEWFPGAGEIISAGYFYKYFDKPAEYYAYDPANTARYDVLITNSDWAKVKGWEFELRKNLGFIHTGWGFLEKLYLSGNLTLQKSEVRAREKHIYLDVEGKDSVTYTYLKYPRALYGQVPLLYNLGMQYSGRRLGVNIAYNYMGYKTFTTGNDPNLLEYERPRAQLDGQITYKLFKGKMEVKLNMSNLTDAPYRFFINDHSTYEIKPESEGKMDLEWNDRYQYKDGFSEKFDEGYVDQSTGQQVGDRKTFTRYVGRTFSFSVSYNF